MARVTVPGGWNPEYQIDIDEEVDHYQKISLTINKLKQKNIEKPVSTEIEKVMPIIREVFLEHYALAVKNIYESELDDGECYIHKRTKDWIIVRYFSWNEKRKYKIEMDTRDSVEDLWMIVHTEHGHKNRPYSRKDGEAITLENFQRFLHLTMQFLYDSDSYSIFLEDYIKNFKDQAKGDSKIEGFILSREKSFGEILDQLNLRKNALEKKLIENETDSALDRAQLRGN